MRWRRALVATVVTALLAGRVVVPPGAAPLAELDVPGRGLPDAGEWRSDASAGRILADPSRTPAARVDRAFDRLGPTEERALVRKQPGVVGNLDGVPPRLRYAANRKVAGDRMSGRQLLVYDRRGGGLVAEVLGDLSTADRVAVLVPGSSVDTTRFDREFGPAYAARKLLAEARRRAPDTRLAVIAWAGYLTAEDDSIEQARGELAQVGAEKLRRLLTGLATSTWAPISLFCHSYGTVTCGLAAPYDAQVGDVVAYASPGMRLASATEIGPRTRLWASRNRSDWIRRVPHVRWGAYGHGVDPMSPDFGARRIDAGSAKGHGGYFEPGTASLARFTDIALGRHDRDRST